MGMSKVDFLVKQGVKRLPMIPAMGPIGRAKALMRAPSIGRLVWALFQDPRVPVWQKGAALSALALVLSPLDLIQAIPVVGEASDLILAMVVNEHILALNLQGRIPLRT